METVIPDGAGVTQYDDSRVSNTSGNVTILKFGEDERKALKWMLPIAVFVGINLAVSALLLFAWQHAATQYSLVYSHQLKEEAYLAAHGIDVTKFGDALPEP